MDKYIIELLKTNETVIIPKFGSLMVTVSGKGIIMFNEHLKFNDGLLVGHVAEKEKISKEDALKKIEEYALGILDTLDGGTTYSIKGLGDFTKDRNGEIQFSQTGGSDDSLKDKPKKESKAVKDDVGIKPTIVNPDSKKDKKTRDSLKDTLSKADSKKDGDKKAAKKVEKEAKKVETPKEEKPAEKRKEKIADTTGVPEKSQDPPEKPVIPITTETPKEAVKKEEPVVGKPEPVVGKPEPVADKKAEPVKTVKKADPMAHVAPQEEVVELPEVVAVKKKKKRKRLAWLIILLLLIGAGTFTALQFDMVKGWYNDVMASVGGSEDKKKPAKADKKEPEPEEVVVSDTAVVDSSMTDTSLVVEEIPVTEPGEQTTTPKPKPKPKKTTPEPVQSAGSSGQYHIIANAFSKESNADRYVADLKGKGLNANKLGRINGLYQVSAGSYASMQDAKSSLSDIRSRTGTEAWIMKY